ncbi:MAG: DUF3223 domain-containing protein [bacterium]
MKQPLIIGSKEYKFKKDAIAHYQNILNSYGFGQNLNDDDYCDIIDLLDYNFVMNFDEIDMSDENNNEVNEIEETEEIDIIEESEVEEDLIIEDVRIAKVQYNTKCFELVYNDSSSEIISYRNIINRPKYNPDSLFSIACRNVISKDLFAVKQQYFKDYSVKGYAKCQETNQMSKWEELAVDHRQPNTFSIIVDRFKEVFNIDVNNIEYEVDDDKLFVLKEDDLKEKFRNYHKEKANLRIVRNECNLSRTSMAKLKRNSKDLSIK